MFGVSWWNTKFFPHPICNKSNFLLNIAHFVVWEKRVDKEEFCSKANRPTKKKGLKMIKCMGKWKVVLGNYYSISQKIDRSVEINRNNLYFTINQKID